MGSSFPVPFLTCYNNRLTMPEKVLVFTAWPYANGPLHLGHVAGCYLPADIFARYHRTAGNEVLMLSGSDQHGTPVTVRAEQEGVSPAEVARLLGCSREYCRQVVQRALRKLRKAGIQAGLVEVGAP